MPNIRIGKNDFEPAIFSFDELKFLLDHMEKPPVVAMTKVPPAVNRSTVHSWLERLYGLQQLKEHNGAPWAGYDAIKDSILRYLEWSKRTAEIRRRGGPHNASMYSWDSTGGANKYGIDSDSGFVRSEILSDGSRRPFGVKLLEQDGRYTNLLSDVAPWIKGTATGTSAAFTDDLATEVKGKFGTIACPICGKTEEFQVSSRQSKSGALGRMARHLKGAKVESARHRVLYRKRFESPDVKL